MRGFAGEAPQSDDMNMLTPRHLTVSGGLLGIAMGRAIAKGVAFYAGWNTIVTVWSIALSLGVSVAVGLVLGSYPAVRAARLDPVEALRYE